MIHYKSKILIFLNGTIKMKLLPSFFFFHKSKIETVLTLAIYVLHSKMQIRQINPSGIDSNNISSNKKLQQIKTLISITIRGVVNGVFYVPLYPLPTPLLHYHRNRFMSRSNKHKYVGLTSLIGYALLNFKLSCILEMLGG